MTIYNKPAVLPAWAEDKVGVPADMLQPVDADIKAGWPLSAIPPSRQRFNWLLNYAANAIRYFMQLGLVNYDAAEAYRVGSRVIGDDGKTYRSIQAANTGNTPSTSPLWWERWGYTKPELDLELAAGASHGQCILSLSGANLLLSPRNGNRLKVAGVVCTIPDAGVTLAPPAVANTTYNIYALAVNGVITSLEASATAHVPDATAGANRGVEIKTGDATRTFVGIARTTAANAWVNSRARRFVRSWFNNAGAEGGNFFVTGRTTASASYVEISTGERVEFLSFLGEKILLATSGRMTNDYASGAGAEISVGVDSAAPVDMWGYSGLGGGPAFTSAGSVGSVSNLTEGYHYATIIGRSTGLGNVTYQGSATAGSRTTLTVLIG